VLKRSAVDDFIKGRTQPERRTIEAFGRLYLVFHPLGYVEKRTVSKRVVLTQLKEALPEDTEESALQFIENLIAAGEEKGLFKRSSEPFREWLTTLVAAEYDIEKKYAHYERRRRPRGGGQAGPGSANTDKEK
jgi:hypothetical protein